MTLSHDSSSAVPADERLEAASTLLDASEVGLLVGQRVKIRYLDYEPSVSLTVRYRTDAMAEFVLCTPQRFGVGDAVDGLDATIVWFPADVALAGLAEVLGADGAELLAWVPGRRAVVAGGDTIVKLYAEDEDVHVAAAAIEQICSAATVTTPALLGTDRARRSVTQQRLGGRTVGRAEAVRVAPFAARTARRFHSSIIDETKLVVVDARALMSVVAAPVRLVSFVRPDLAARLDRIVHHLSNGAPDDLDLVPSHGDYNIGQLMTGVPGLRAGDLAVLDLDTLCMAPAAFDLAGYATNLQSGRTGDAADAMAAVARLTHAYGGGIVGLDWFLAAQSLRRVDRPFRRLKSGWRDRVDTIVAWTEDLTGIRH